VSITPETIAHVAKLARLALDPAQAQAALGQVNQMLDVFEALNAIDVSGVTPLFHPGDPSLRLRADQISESDAHEAFQAIAPDVSADLYLVPKVLEAG
jgi:aspartyl-tRNA(Asn)/glutamyl-tRNA(Gln) amidotransferase subunit C